MGSRFKRKLPSGKFIVYRMECKVNGKSYIGITVNLAHRLAQHWSEAKNGKKTILYRTIRKYGKQSFVIVEIDRAKTWNEVCEKEQYYIKYFKTKNPAGMNLTDGGEGNSGLVISEETRQRQSEAHIGLHVGENGGGSKLIEADIIDMRKRYKEGGITYRQLAIEYNVDYTNVACIISGKTWTFLDENILGPLEIAERASISRKRAMSGEKHHQAKLIEQDIIAIRKQYKEEIISTPQLAAEYNMTKEAISNIISGRSWRHIQEGILTPLEIKKRQSQFRKNTYIGEKGCNHKLTERDVIFIRKECKRKSKSYRQFADKYNVHPDTISNIIKRKSWAHI